MADPSAGGKPPSTDVDAGLRLEQVFDNVIRMFAGQRLQPVARPTPSKLAALAR